jgi:CheY-like chemotaxis protein
MNRKWPRLLVVDDDPTVARWTTLILGRYFEKGVLDVDGEIVDCRDGNTALRILREEGPFDLVLTDVMMNRMSGLELATRIRSGETESGSHPTPRSVVVVAYSGGFAGGLDELGPEFAAFDGAINKPWEPGQLVRSLIRFLVRSDREDVLTRNLPDDD